MFYRRYASFRRYVPNSGNNPTRSHNIEFRRPRKLQARIKQFITIIGIDWNAKIAMGDNDTIQLQSPDENFDLNIRVEEKTSTLSITSCIYSCSSDAQSSKVMKKALELNYTARNRHEYTLAIDPSPREDKMQSVDLTLCLTKLVGGIGVGAFRNVINAYIEAAINVRSQLESADDGILGALPLKKTNIASDPISDMGLIQNTIAVAPLMCATPPQRTPSPPPPPPKLPSKAANIFADREIVKRRQSCVNVVPRKHTARSANQPIRSKSLAVGLSAKSFTKESILSQFDSPAEAKMFETYIRKKKEYTRRCSKIAAEGKESSGALKRELSSSTPSQRPTSVVITPDLDATPVISNKKRHIEGYHHLTLTI